MAWAAEDLETFPSDVEFSTVSEGRVEQISISEFPGGLEERFSYSDQFKRTWSLKTVPMSTTNVDLFLALWGNTYGQRIPFIFAWRSVNYYVRFSGGFQITWITSALASISFSIIEVHSSEVSS